jgi:hypothetical protein
MFRVRSATAWLLAALGALAVSDSPTKVLGADRPALRSFTSTQFEKIERLADLPLDVRAALDLKIAPMAEAGHDWNAGCMVDSRPKRRFIYAGKSPDLWFVFFEVGGRSDYQLVLTFRRLPGGKLEREGEWAFNALPTTISELKKTVRKYGVEN